MTTGAMEVTHAFSRHVDCRRVFEEMSSLLLK